MASIALAQCDFTSEPTIDVALCVRCGMGFTAEVPPQLEVDARYEAHSKYAVHVPKPAGSAAMSRFDARAEPEWDLERLRHTAAFLAQLCTPKAPTLDVGCATGALLAALEEAGFTQLFGLEPSPEAVRTAAATTRATVYVGSAFAPPPGLPQMQLVTLSHVLEHVADVHAVLAATVGLLAEGGLLYVEVPDATRYHEYVAAPYQDFNTEHLNHFSPGLMDRAVVQHGLQRVRLERKTSRCAPTAPYPATFGVWRKPASPNGQPAPQAGRDDELPAALARYAELSAARMEALDAQLARALQAGDRVVVWGAGELLLKLLKSSVLGRCRIEAIIDASPSKQGRRIEGTTITAPTALPPSQLPIVVTSLVHRDSIVDALRARFGPKRPIVALT